MEGNKLVNKDASWEPEEQWNITKAPGRGILKKIENKNKKVLEVPEKNKEGNVAEESYNKNKTGQLWKKGIADNDGYFTLINKESSEFLAADSDGDFKVKGTMIHFLCFNDFSKILLIKGRAYFLRHCQIFY